MWRAHGGGNAGWAYFEAMRSRMSDPTVSEPRYYVGVNLGQSRDPTPIAVVRRVDPPRPVPEKEKPKWIFYSKPLPAPRNPLILLRRVRNLTLT